MDFMAVDFQPGRTFGVLLGKLFEEERGVLLGLHVATRAKTQHILGVVAIPHPGPADQMVGLECPRLPAHLAASRRRADDEGKLVVTAPLPAFGGTLGRLGRELLGGVGRGALQSRLGRQPFLTPERLV